MSSKFSATSLDSFVCGGRRYTNLLKMSITDIIYLYVSPSMVAGILAILTRSTWCLSCTLHALIGLRGALFSKSGLSFWGFFMTFNFFCMALRDKPLNNARYAPLISWHPHLLFLGKRDLLFARFLIFLQPYNSMACMWCVLLNSQRSDRGFLSLHTSWFSVFGALSFL